MYSQWRRRLPVLFQIVLPILILSIAILLGYGTFPEIGYQILETRVPATLKDFPEIELIRLQKFLKTEFKIAVSEARRQVPAILGFGVGLVILALGYELWFQSNHKRKSSDTPNQSKTSYGYWLLTAFILVGTIVTPIIYYYQTPDIETCKGDVIAAHRIAGEHLSELISPDAQVYWDAGESFAPLLYVPGIKIYPPQINGAYSYKLGGYDYPDSVLRLGYWNAFLDYEWQREADFVLLQSRMQQESPNTYVLSSGEFIELESTPPLNPCDPLSSIRIFKKKQ